MSTFVRYLLPDRNALKKQARPKEKCSSTRIFYRSSGRQAGPTMTSCTQRGISAKPISQRLTVLEWNSDAAGGLAEEMRSSQAAASFWVPFVFRPHALEFPF